MKEKPDVFIEALKDRPLLTHHEKCVCGHCRCQHDSWYQGCDLCPKCIRYTWPGQGADLPANHARATAGNANAKG